MMRQRIPVEAHHHEHLAQLGVEQAPEFVEVTEADYQKYYERWKLSLPDADEETLHTKVIGHLAWKHHIALKNKPVAPARIIMAPKWEMRALIAVLLLILLLLFFHPKAHAQFSHINTITLQNNDGSTAAFLASPFTMKAGVNCTWVFASQVATINCTGGAGGAGGVNSQVQWNSANALAGIATFTTDGTVNTAKVGTNWNFVDPADTSKKLQFNLASITTANTRTLFIPDAAAYAIKAGATTGQIPIWNAGTSTYDVSDPLVQGTQAAASVTIPNPVVIGGSDYGGTAAVRVFKVDASGNGFVTFSNSTIAVTGTFWQATQPVSNAGTFATQATLAAETTKVIGTVNVAAGQTIGITANSAVNVAQINGVAPLMGAGNTGTGSPRVTVSTDQAALPTWGHGATGSAVPAGATQVGGTDGTNLIVPYIDPCQRGAKTKTLINLASTTSTKLVALASAKVIYVCSINLVVAGANNVALISGTKVTNECDTSTVGVNGGTSAASGWNFAANGGLTHGNGSAWVLSGGTALDLCIVASANTQVSGSITTVTF